MGSRLRSVPQPVDRRSEIRDIHISELKRDLEIKRVTLTAILAKYNTKAIRVIYGKTKQR